jgi:hypothetical protein
MTHPDHHSQPKGERAKIQSVACVLYPSEALCKAPRQGDTPALTDWSPACGNIALLESQP